MQAEESTTSQKQISGFPCYTGSYRICSHFMLMRFLYREGVGNVVNSAECEYRREILLDARIFFTVENMRLWIFFILLFCIYNPNLIERLFLKRWWRTMSSPVFCMSIFQKRDFIFEKLYSGGCLIEKAVSSTHNRMKNMRE